MSREARITGKVRRALNLLARHHSKPCYLEMYNQNWGQNMQWGGWSPQYPKQSRQQQRRSRDGGDRGKDRKKEEGVARPYDSSTPSSLQPQSSTASGSTETQFMKEFLEMARESKMQIPERLQMLLPDGTKDAIRDQQKKLNRHRNVVNKIDSKKKALELDKERWSSWLQEMKEQIVKQRGNFEENQKRLQKELEALEEEERKICSQDSKEDEEEDLEEPSAEQMVDSLMDELKEEDAKASVHKDTGGYAPGSTELQDAIKEMQQRMESRYQEKLKEQQRMWEEMWWSFRMEKVQPLQLLERRRSRPEGGLQWPPLEYKGRGILTPRHRTAGPT